MEPTQAPVIYDDEVDPKEIEWIPTPIDGQIIDIAFVWREGKRIPVRKRMK